MSQASDMVVRMFDVIAAIDAEDELALAIMGKFESDPTAYPSRSGLLADLEFLPPDIRLAVVLFSTDVDKLSDRDRVRYLQASERLNAAGQARTYRAMCAIADSYAGLDLSEMGDSERGAALEIRAALRLTRRSAEVELDFALDLRARLPRLAEALAEGLVDRKRAGVLVRHTSHLPVAEAREVVARTIGDAGRLTTGQLTEVVRSVCLDVDPDSAADRYREARSDRRLVAYPDPDGTNTICLNGVDPVLAGEALDRISRLAQDLRGDGEVRTMDQLRADVALDLLRGTTGPARHGTVHITADLSTLAGLDDHPAYLAGYGPVAADIARQAITQMGTGAWEWTATHPESGMPMADGTTRRRPTASQTRRVRARTRTCATPGCRAPAVNCDIDHIQPWSETGVTQTSQLAPSCRHDHCTRHLTGWTYQPLPNGDFLWKSPLGCMYTTSGNDP